MSIFWKETIKYIKSVNTKRVTSNIFSKKKKRKNPVKIRREIYPYNFPKNKWSPRI